MSTNPVKKKIRIVYNKSEEAPSSSVPEKKEIKFREPEQKERAISISPQAELMYRKLFGKEGKGVGISARKSLASKESQFGLSGEYKGASGSVSYSPSDKRIDFSADVPTKRGGLVSARKEEDYYSTSYTSPKGKSISLSSDKELRVSSPIKKGGEISASISPREASAYLTTKRGNIFSAGYNKEDKSAKFGATIPIKKRK